LAAVADGAHLLRPRRVTRHEVGDVLELDLTGVAPAWKAKAAFELETYVGGGFAGQVYRARLLRFEWHGDRTAPTPLEVGGVYAVKIFVPWSRFGRFFRNVLYGIGFQAPFGLQVNASAVRAAALWHKLFRRGAAERMGAETCVVDVHATFYEPGLGSMGQVLEWIDGRVWRLDVDDHIFRKKWAADAAAAPRTGEACLAPTANKWPADAAAAPRTGEACLAPTANKWPADAAAAPPYGRGMPRPYSKTWAADTAAAPPQTEYAAKRGFMRRLVNLFHEMGAPELARQYEWWTMKSQPNVLKRHGAGDGPADGLVAVDFGAGLALLPFLPMSPADVKLILRGLACGRIVQFDRGDLDRLEAFVHAHPERFEGLGGAVAELRMAEARYHGAQLDLANHRLRVLRDNVLREKACRAWADGYAARHVMDAEKADRMGARPVRLTLFVLLGLVPLVGRFFQRLWGSATYRRHVGRMLTRLGYLRRAVRARQAEILIDWHRKGRVTERRARALVRWPVAFWLQRFTLAILPAAAHRVLTDRRYAWDVFRYLCVRPFGLYFSRVRREQWLRDMIEEGRADGVLDDEETEQILSHIREPYIQTYLLSLVVHLFTIPITQIVSVLLGYWLAARYGGSTAESGAIFGGTVVLFQFTPISPGSLTRGLYATGLAVWKRDWKNYSLAVCLSYWKYIGYLGFPIQMVQAYPTLATFMATRWATHAIGIVPVFGEKGALLEHGVFNLFFNAPVSLMRQWRDEREGRARLRGVGGLLGSFGRIGFIPGPSGTFASLAVGGLVAAAYYLGAPWWSIASLALAATVVGVPVGTWFEKRIGRHDPRPFVLDEVAGMLIASLAAWLPTDRWGWLSLMLAFFWFRVCDIIKPPPVRQAERLPGGWGIMADDVLAGALALGLTVACQMLVTWQTG